MDKEEKYVVCTNKGGIANRVKCIISLLRLGEKDNRILYLYWPLNHTCGARFSDLFENKIYEINENELSNIQRREITPIEDDTLGMINSSRKYIISGTWRFLLTQEELKHNHYLNEKRKYDEKGIDFNFSDVPELVKMDILRSLKLLKPIKSIQEEIEGFQIKHNLKEMVGIHIRRGDFADRKVSPGRVSSDERFIEKINCLIKDNPKTKFFLCTDSKEMEDRIEEEFPKRIIKFKKSSFVRTDIRATQEGLIDMILLSKTKQIIGTYRSTFTELAWWLGECKAKIEMIVDPEKEREYILNTKMEKRRIVPKIKRIILKLIGRRFF